MAQTIEDVESRTLLQQFHSLYKKQDSIETNVENVDAKIGTEKTERQAADLSINSQIQELKNEIQSLGVLFTYKGEVATIQDLPATGNKPGDVYYVDSVQSGYVWIEKNGVLQWEEFGPAIDLSQYAKQEDLEQTQSELTATDTQVKNNTTQITNLTNSKQDKLTAGTNITIDANNVISASGGLTEVKASDVDSEQATLGQVLTADGNGGASWQNASGGDKLYLHKILFTGFRGVILYIKNNTSTTFTGTTLGNYLRSIGIGHAFGAVIQDKDWLPCGYQVVISSNSIRRYFGVSTLKADNSRLQLLYEDISISTDGTNISITKSKYPQEYFVDTLIDTVFEI